MNHPDPETLTNKEKIHHIFEYIRELMSFIEDNLSDEDKDKLEKIWFTADVLTKHFNNFNKEMIDVIENEDIVK